MRTREEVPDPILTMQKLNCIADFGLRGFVDVYGVLERNQIFVDGGVDCSLPVEDSKGVLPRAPTFVVGRIVALSAVLRT